MAASEAPITAPGERIERTVTVQGISTHLFEAGTANATPLLYLHGMMLGNLWLDYHRTLAQHFHVFAPDIPGFGLTERPNWLRDMDDYVLYLRDLLDALGLEKPLVAGHSLGGWMAAEIAVWYPERVSKLVLSNSAGIRVKGSLIGDVFAMKPEELLFSCFDDLSAAAPLIPLEISTDYLLGQFRQLTTVASLAWNPHFDPKLERRLAHVHIPTLIIWGEHDRLIPPVYADAFYRAIAGSQLVKLAGTGHMPMFEKAQEWSNALIEFLTEASSQEVRGHE